MVVRGYSMAGFKGFVALDLKAPTTHTSVPADLNFRRGNQSFGQICIFPSSGACVR